MLERNSEERIDSEELYSTFFMLKNPPRSDSYDRYKQIKLLGFGGFGYVQLVVDTHLKLKNEEAA